MIYCGWRSPPTWPLEGPTTGPRTPPRSWVTSTSRSGRPPAPSRSVVARLGQHPSRGHVDSLDNIVTAPVLAGTRGKPWGCLVAVQDPDRRTVETNQRDHYPK
jgi:hypothetical protein